MPKSIDPKNTVQRNWEIATANEEGGAGVVTAEEAQAIANAATADPERLEQAESAARSISDQLGQRATYTLPKAMAYNHVDCRAEIGVCLQNSDRARWIADQIKAAKNAATPRKTFEENWQAALDQAWIVTREQGQAIVAAAKACSKQSVQEAIAAAMSVSQALDHRARFELPKFASETGADVASQIDMCLENSYRARWIAEQLGRATTKP